MRSHNDWQAIRRLLPFLKKFKGRVLFALGLLTLAKLANVTVPITLKHAIDALDPQHQEIIYLPVFMLVAYGLLRFASSAFSELRDALFAKVVRSRTRKRQAESQHRVNVGVLHARAFRAR